MLAFLLAALILDDGARLQAVLSLRAAQSPENYAGLEEAMNSDLNDKVRLAAAQGLLLYSGSKSLADVESFVAQEQGAGVREGVCLFLSSPTLRAQDAQTTAFLARRLAEDPSAKVRLAAASALEARKDRRALKSLLLAAEGDSDKSVRLRARKAHKSLSKLPPPGLALETKPVKAQDRPYEPRRGIDPCTGGNGWCQCSRIDPPVVLPARCQSLEDCQDRYDDFYRRNGYRCSWDDRPLE